MTSYKPPEPHRVKSLPTHRVKVTDNARLFGIHDLLRTWGSNVIGRRNVLVVITAPGQHLGAPARYVPTLSEVHVPEEALSSVRMDRIRTIIDFIRLHPVVAGRFVHEFCHARCSPSMETIKVAANMVNDQRARSTAIMLLEGHAEVQGSKYLSGLEKAALESTVLELVLEGVTKPGEELKINPYTAANLLGLIAGRMDAGIIDSKSEDMQRVVSAVKSNLDEVYAPMYEIAVQAANLPEGVGMNIAESLAEMVREWLRLLDTIAPPDQGGSPDDSESDEESEEESEGDPGGGGNKGDGEEEEEESEGGGEDGDGGDDGEGEEDSDGDEGEDGEESEDGNSRAFGKYAHATDEELGRMVERALGSEKQSKIEKVKQVAIVAVEAERHKTSAANAKRKRLNKEYGKRWRK